MFEFKVDTDNIVKFSCLLCLPKKNVSPFANSLSNLRQHVEVRTESYTFLSFFKRLYYTGRTLHKYHARVCGFRSGVTLPELLKMLSYVTAVLNCSKDCVSFITLCKLFQILGVTLKNECLNSYVLSHFNL